ncbi:FHIPEP family type III secretion protein, partial [Priestia megaterium]|nr:FHIPEP family type III secretion protein [Priestia megaterium]
MILLAEGTHNNVSGTGRRNRGAVNAWFYFRNGTNGYTISVLRNKSQAAGKVVEAFGHFLVGGNFAIGIVVFVILVIINFMVITKGAGRIAE